MLFKCNTWDYVPRRNFHTSPKKFRANQLKRIHLMRKKHILNQIIDTIVWKDGGIKLPWNRQGLDVFYVFDQIPNKFSFKCFKNVWPLDKQGYQIEMMCQIYVNCNVNICQFDHHTWCPYWLPCPEFIWKSFF